MVDLCDKAASANLALSESLFPLDLTGDRWKKASTLARLHSSLAERARPGDDSVRRTRLSATGVGHVQEEGRTVVCVASASAGGAEGRLFFGVRPSDVVHTHSPVS